MPLYATAQQYRDWSGDQSAVLSQRDLERASDLVTDATLGAVYTTTAGMPTGAVLEAMRKATLEVLDARAAAAAGGELDGVEEATIGSVRFKLAAATPTEPSTGLPVEAYRALKLAGLVGGPVSVYG